jgi:hypothetical protein
MRVLSYDEAAARAGIVRRSLERLIACAAIVYVSIRRRGVIEADLERWLLSRRRAPPGEVAPSKISEPACSTSERDPQSDALKMCGRPGGVKPVRVAPDRVAAAEAERGAV